MSFETLCGKRLMPTIERDVLNLVVVNDIRAGSRIRERIDIAFTRRACAGNHFRIDDLELTLALLTPQDIESSVVQLRGCYPLDNNRTGIVAHGTETRE